MCARNITIDDIHSASLYWEVRLRLVSYNVFSETDVLPDGHKLLKMIKRLIVDALPNHERKEVGDTAAVASLCGVSKSAVSNWKTRGIPKPWLMFLRKEFPDLKAWHLADADNHQPMKE